MSRRSPAYRNAIARDVTRRLAAMPAQLTEMTPAQIIDHPPGAGPERAWYSSGYYVSLRAKVLSVQRMSARMGVGRGDPLAPEELRHIKSECGFGHCRAAEYYPPDEAATPDFGRIRHLRLLDRATNAEDADA